jgi:diguanylate cyclase (GGDEF)-like protein
MSQHESSMELAELEGRALATERAVARRLRDGLLAPVGRRGRGSRRRVSRAAIAGALDMAAEAVYFAAPDLQIVETNAAAISSTGFSSERLTRMNLRELISDECEGQLRSNVARLMRREVAETSHRARQLCNDRQAFAVRVRMRVIEQADTAIVVALVERQGELDASIVAESGRDFLTGLASREALEARLRRAERHVRKQGGQFAVLFVDLDDFKQINDAHGHRVGDQVLRTVAERLLGCMRPGDFVGRYGGDEFVVVVDDLDREMEVERIVERIRCQLAVSIDVAGCVLRVSTSVGVAVGLPRSSVEQILDSADRDMYRTKRSNRKAGSPITTAERRADAARS